MFWFGKNKLTKWGIDLCSKMLSEMKEEYGGYLEQINSGLIKEVVPAYRYKECGDYMFKLDAKLSTKYIRSSEPEFVLKGFMLKNDSGEFVDSNICFLNGMICGFYVKSRIKTNNLIVLIENVRKLTFLNHLPEEIMEIFLQQKSVDINTICSVDIRNLTIYHLITQGNNLIDLEGCFEVVYDPLEVKPFIGDISGYIGNTLKEYNYEHLPKMLLNIICLRNGFDFNIGSDIRYIDGYILYHLMDTEDGNFIGIKVDDGKFIYYTHDPFEFNIITKDVRIYNVTVENRKICHLFDTELGNFIGISKDFAEFVEVSNNRTEVKRLEKDFSDYLK
jgi:hypothetical protein